MVLLISALGVVWFAAFASLFRSGPRDWPKHAFSIDVVLIHFPCKVAELTVSLLEYFSRVSSLWQDVRHVSTCL